MTRLLAQLRRIDAEGDPTWMLVPLALGILVISVTAVAHLLF
ncbi:hypothetical protein [Schumannella sp. 10F1B-5-1]|nr:hypothetical protein [Schumannella sp. 10F1B-5-1]